MNDDDIDYEQAAQELLIEAKQGNAESQCLLGQMYYEGVGVKQDYKQSALWFTKAAKYKHAEAQYFLGLQYQNGQGVKQNQTEAEAWFQRAAKLGNVDAKAALAEIAKSKESPVSESSTPPANVPEPQPVPVVNTKKKIITIIAILIILGVAGIKFFYLLYIETYDNITIILRNKTSIFDESILGKHFPLTAA